MKTKLITLFLLIVTLMLAVPMTLSAEGLPSEASRPSSSAEAPSATTYLEYSKRNITEDNRYTSYNANSRVRLPRAGLNNGWSDLMNDGTDIGGGHDVGGPIGDATLPIAVSILIFYLIFRGINIAKRKSDL